jgi:acetyl esterase
VSDRLWEVEDAYLRGIRSPAPGQLDLADPLVVLERGEAPQRALPAFFAAVGTKDILLDDTRRLKLAVERLGGVCESRYYPGEAHAFHAMVFRKSARRCWRDSFEFLDQHLAAPASSAAASATAGRRP